MVITLFNEIDMGEDNATTWINTSQNVDYPTNMSIQVHWEDADDTDGVFNVYLSNDIVNETAKHATMVTEGEGDTETILIDTGETTFGNAKMINIMNSYKFIQCKYIANSNTDGLLSAHLVIDERG